MRYKFMNNYDHLLRKSHLADQIHHNIIKEIAIVTFTVNILPISFCPFIKHSPSFGVFSPCLRCKELFLNLS